MEHQRQPQTPSTNNDQSSHPDSLSDVLMDSQEWVLWENRLIEQGPERFFKKYLVTEKIDKERFILNLKVAIRTS